MGARVLRLACGDGTVRTLAPPSVTPVATCTEFVRCIKRLMPNDVYLLHCNIKSLTQYEEKALRYVIFPYSKPTDIIGLSEKIILWNSIHSQFPGYNFISENFKTYARGAGAYFKNSNFNYLRRYDLHFQDMWMWKHMVWVVGRKKSIIKQLSSNPQVPWIQQWWIFSITIWNNSNKNCEFYTLSLWFSKWAESPPWGR